MVSLKFSIFLWAFLLFFAQFHSGYSLFLGHKKELLKHKLYKLKEALLDDHHGHDEVHYHHYKVQPIYYPSISYGKYSSYDYGFPSYGWKSYGGWSGHY